MLQTCVEEGVKRDYTDERIMTRIMATNLGALHTTSMVRLLPTYTAWAHASDFCRHLRTPCTTSLRIPSTLNR